MVLELTLSNVITVLALFVMALWALVKVISAQQDRRLSERFGALDQTMQAIAKAQGDNAKSIRELEQAFNQHQLDVAVNYLRRDEFVRTVGGIETRIDNFALRMERALSDLVGVKK